MNSNIDINSGLSAINFNNLLENMENFSNNRQPLILGKLFKFWEHLLIN